MLPIRFLFAIMHFFMAKLQVIIDSLCQPASIALCTVYAAMLTHHRHTKQPYKYTGWLMSDGAQCQEQAATEHLQHVISNTLKKKKVIKEPKKEQVETKWSLLSKNVIFWNITLVTYTYIYIKENQYYLQWISDICFTSVMCEKMKSLFKLKQQFLFTNCVGNLG